MAKRPKQRIRAAFTLIEVLVTLLILALLVAIVFPVVVGRLGDSDPVRIAGDLTSIRTGVNLFSVDVRLHYPATLEQLTAPIQPTDLDLKGNQYSARAASWDGPYLDLSIVEGAAIATGYGATIRDTLRGFDPATNLVEDPASIADGDFLAVLLLGLDSTRFEALNDAIDGEGEPPGLQAAGRAGTVGRLRFRRGASVDTVVYLAVPYKD